MPITYHQKVEQGTPEWHALRCGILTASEVKLILTPTLKIANNEKTRSHVYEIAAQRISQYTEPSYIGDDMLRGFADEIKARDLYSEKYAPVTEVGFITNDDLGFTIGYSPDGVVNDYGLIEIKSRKQKYQVQTIVDGEIPDEHILQCQTGLFVTGRKWIDYVSVCFPVKTDDNISYEGGLPMCVIRAYPIPEIQEAIKKATIEFEAKVQEVINIFYTNTTGER